MLILSWSLLTFVGLSSSFAQPNSNCTLLAVSNEQTSDDDTYSRVTIVRDLEAELPSISIIPLDNVEGDNRWDDAYVLKKGLHMPLTKKALEYWDELSPIANETDFKDVRQKYQSTIFIEGESLAWAGTSESELLINLQNNNGLLRIDVARNRALALAGYGLRDHSVIPVDINSNDKNCNGRTYPNLFSMRNPDTIATIKYNDKLYVLTANEGDRKEFGSFVDEIEARQLFQSGGLGLPRVKAPET